MLLELVPASPRAITSAFTNSSMPSTEWTNWGAAVDFPEPLGPPRMVQVGMP